MCCDLRKAYRSARRLQLSGIRLLALWAQLDPNEDPSLADEDLREFIREAKAYEVSRDVIANLKRAGLSHAAAWISTIASRLCSGEDQGRYGRAQHQ